MPLNVDENTADIRSSSAVTVTGEFITALNRRWVRYTFHILSASRADSLNEANPSINGCGPPRDSCITMVRSAVHGSGSKTNDCARGANSPAKTARKMRRRFIFVGRQILHRWAEIR